MTSSTRADIPDFEPHKPSLRCSQQLWLQCLYELKQRGQGTRESGAFLLGRIQNQIRMVERFVPYDDLDPEALDRGYIHFRGEGFPKLWELCRNHQMMVVADVHTHPGPAFFSHTDRENPMIPQLGHLAVVIPNFASEEFIPQSFAEYGIFEYQGNLNWIDHSNKRGFFVVEKELP